MRWLDAYRAALVDGRSMRAVRIARRLTIAATLLWAVAVVVLIRTAPPGGTGMNTLILSTVLLALVYLAYGIVQLFFLPTRR